MKTTILYLSLGLMIFFSETSGQKGPRYFGEAILTDTFSTMFFPTRYNAEFLSTNKIAFWGDYYANFVVYDFVNDVYKKLFAQDVFIESFRSSDSYGTRAGQKIKNITPKWIFLLVKPKDTNDSGRIDDKDPSILFAVTPKGENLRPLTDETENVVSFQVFEKQGFVLLNIQRDSDKDNSFKSEDKEHYYVKISLADLKPGKPIELK